MDKEVWKAGNVLYPIPAVLVSCISKEGNKNIITIGWTGTICTNPPMVYISVRPDRYSYGIIEGTKDFVINLTTKKLIKAVDYCGVKSGRDVDKFKEMNLTPVPANKVKSPLIQESPVNIECSLKEIVKLGSHDMFIANVLAVNVDKSYIDQKGKFDLNKANPIVYSHGGYYTLGEIIGTFGYSIKKKKRISK